MTVIASARWAGWRWRPTSTRPRSRCGTIRNGGATDKERALFEAKFGELRRRVAMLDVWLNVDHALVTIDKDTPFPVSGRGWWRFVAPGEHEILVEERGYEAERQRFRTEAGKELSLHTDLRKVGEEKRAPEEVEAPKIEAPKVPVREEPGKEQGAARSAAGIVVYRQPQREAEAEAEAPARRWAIGAGAVVTFGATPGGAVGPTLSPTMQATPTTRALTTDALAPPRTTAPVAGRSYGRMRVMRTSCPRVCLKVALKVASPCFTDSTQ